MRTEATHIYSAQELRDAHPDGYARAREWWTRTVYDDPAWAEEHRQSWQRAVDAIRSMPAFNGPTLADDVRRCMAWVENNVLAPLRCRRPTTVQRRYGYRRGAIPACPWTSYCADDDALDTIRAVAKEGLSGRDMRRRIEGDADAAWGRELDWQTSEEYFLDACASNGYEFTADGAPY